MKLTKFNQKGMAHFVIPVFVIVVFGLVGSFMLFRSHADEPKFVKYPWSPCVFLRNEIIGRSPYYSYVSKSDYDRLGRPRVVTQYRIGNDELYRNTTHNEEIFLTTRNFQLNACPDHHLTASQWAIMGRPAAPTRKWSAVQYSSGPSIYYSVDNGPFKYLSRDEWIKNGQPTPQRY